MISYEHTGQVIKVRLDKKIIGEIRVVAGGYAYFPKGRKSLMGDVFETVQAVKRSLEEE